MNISSRPTVILGTIALALYLGVAQKTVALALAPVGDLYVDLLKMCVVPILFSIIALSIMKLMISPNMRRYVMRILAVFPIALVLTALLGVAVGVVVRPGARLGHHERASLGVAVSRQNSTIDVALDTPPEPSQLSAAQQIVDAVIPQNVFAALASGDAIKIVIFSLIFGTSLGLLYGARYHVVYEFVEEVYHAFYQILTWLLVALPIGLLCIMASQTARTDVRVFLAMTSFFAAFTGVVVVLCSVALVAIALLARVRFREALAAFKETLLLAFSTRNTFACIPVAVSALQLLQFEEDASELLVPFAVSFCRFGSVAYFAIGAVFVAQLYGTAGGLGSMLLIAGVAVFGGLATAGSTGIASLLPLGMVLHSIGLPFDAMLVLFIAIDPIVDPVRTMLQVAGGAAVAAAVAGSRRTMSMSEEPPPEAAYGTSAA